MNVHYVVALTPTERGDVEAVVASGTTRARKRKRAQVLLAAAAGVADQVIAATVGVGPATIYRTKRRFVEGGLERALQDDPRPGAGRKLTAKDEALRVAVACSKPPTGCARWTLELLAGEVVRLTEHTALSREKVRRRLQEKALKPWQHKMWCLTAVDAEFVARMEDVLDLYAARPPADAARGVLRRDADAVDRRDAGAVAARSRTAGPLRL